MRSITPIEGNPWPHDMTITIDDGPQQVMELLWIREAFSLHPVGALPPLLIDTPPRSSAAPDTNEWDDAWPEIWRAVIDHAAQPTDQSLLEQLYSTELEPRQRAELLRRLFGPTWRDSFGDNAFDDGYHSWTEKQFHDRSRRQLQPLAETPERRSLDALIPEWEAGLTKIVTIPCRGDYTRVIGRSALLMTDATRDHPDRYAAALASFR